ncbi:MAG: transcription elongation factor GreA [Candidatus Pacebacteria bacterium]|nr:transcription elongation factor GreA [Candidatus Paceibacterota bacterium]
MVNSTLSRANKVHLTPEGANELRRQLAELKDKNRPEAVDQLAAARDLGDLEENNQYTQAKENLALIDGRIAELEEVIANSVVIEPDKNNGHQISLGSRVTVDLGGQEIIFYLVGEWEANPSEQRISHRSPLGQQLMGKKPGEAVEVQAPVGKLVYKIVKIE